MLSDRLACRSSRTVRSSRPRRSRSTRASYLDGRLAVRHRDDPPRRRDVTDRWTWSPRTARALVDAVTEWARGADAVEVRLSVRRANDRAIRLSLGLASARPPRTAMSRQNGDWSSPCASEPGTPRVRAFPTARSAACGSRYRRPRGLGRKRSVGCAAASSPDEESSVARGSGVDEGVGDGVDVVEHAVDGHGCVAMFAGSASGWEEDQAVDAELFLVLNGGVSRRTRTPAASPHASRSRRRPGTRSHSRTIRSTRARSRRAVTRSWTPWGEASTASRRSTTTDG